MKKRKFLKTIMLFLMVMSCAFIVSTYKTENVQAASAKTMKKAYASYVKKNKKKLNIKRYAYVNIGQSNKPALLIPAGTLADTPYYVDVNVYYYVNGKVKKVFSFFGGTSTLELYKKNGQNYLCAKTYNSNVFLYIVNNKVRILDYINNHETSSKTRKFTYCYNQYDKIAYISGNKEFKKLIKPYKKTQKVKFSKA